MAKGLGKGEVYRSGEVSYHADKVSGDIYKNGTEYMCRGEDFDINQLQDNEPLSIEIIETVRRVNQDERYKRLVKKSNAAFNKSIIVGLAWRIPLYGKILFENFFLLAIVIPIVELIASPIRKRVSKQEELFDQKDRLYKQLYAEKGIEVEKEVEEFTKANKPIPYKKAPSGAWDIVSGVFGIIGIVMALSFLLLIGSPMNWGSKLIILIIAILNLWLWIKTASKSIDL